MKKSKECLKRAKNHMPLGVADSYRYWGEENTVFVDRMEGYGFTDVDGKEYVDFRLGYGPIILGYRDRRIDEKVSEALFRKGNMCGFSVEEESDVAEAIKRLCPQIEKLRFANSGTEAVLGAVRTARGFTNRHRTVVVEGGFHGLYDEMMWKFNVDEWDAEAQKEPDIIPFGAGLARHSNQFVELVPLNDLAALERVFQTYKNEIAGVVIEPIMGNCGSIAATKGYMEGLKKTCKENGALLIVDEVKTGFRVAKGGAQELYKVYADLTTYAKAMGNGYAIAAFGGRADIMDKIHFAQDGVVHGGTYTANLVGLFAAKATLEVLEKTDALKTIEKVGENIKTVLSEVFTAYDIEHTFQGHPSMFGVHFTKEAPIDYRSWKQTNAKLYEKFAWNLIEQGIMLEPDSREPWFLCEAHKHLDLSVLKGKAMKAMNKAVTS